MDIGERKEIRTFLTVIVFTKLYIKSLLAQNPYYTGREGGCVWGGGVIMYLVVFMEVVEQTNQLEMAKHPKDLTERVNNK